MLSKLIESWLDNTSERSYQPVFCQMLMSQGYSVIHSTRHCGIEYGKDVLAIAKDGVPCAFQLKGNPGGGLTLSQFREIRPQLDEMVNQYIEHPSIPKDIPHRSYLVTNGRIEEEVALAIGQSNAKNACDGYPKRRLETVAREQLLKWAIELESALWPSELSELRTLLEILTHRGDELFPIEKFHRLLTSLFKLAPEDPDKMGEPEFNRRLSSAALLTAVALKPFSERANHWAAASAWVTFSLYAIGFAEKYKRSDKLVSQSLETAEVAIWDSLTMLLTEAHQRNGRYGEGNGLADFPVYAWRYTLLMGIGSAYWLECERGRRWLAPDLKDKIESVLTHSQEQMSLWGEGAIPQFLFHGWYINGRDPEAAKKQVVGLARHIMTTPLFWVYHSADEVIRHQLSDTFEAFTSKITQKMEGEAVASHFSETLITHLAQRDLKEVCQSLWGRYSRMSSLVFIPKEPWMYCLWNCEEGDNHSFIPPETGQWADLIARSQEDVQSSVPGQLSDRPFLLALWCLVSPHRAITPVICHLYKSFCVIERKEVVSPAIPSAEAA